MSTPLDHALRRGIAAERARLGLTQRALGDRLHLSARQIMDSESGDRTIPAHELADWCRALDCTLDRLWIAAPADDLTALGLGSSTGGPRCDQTAE